MLLIFSRISVKFSQQLNLHGFQNKTNMHKHFAIQIICSSVLKTHVKDSTFKVEAMSVVQCLQLKS
jgi:hypothetical protein